jgi:hypothetical protein
MGMHVIHALLLAFFSFPSFPFHLVLIVRELGSKYFKPKTRQTNAPHQAKIGCVANPDLAW